MVNGSASVATSHLQFCGPLIIEKEEEENRPERYWIVVGWLFIVMTSCDACVQLSGNCGATFETLCDRLNERHQLLLALRTQCHQRVDIAFSNTERSTLKSVSVRVSRVVIYLSLSLIFLIWLLMRGLAILLSFKCLSWESAWLRSCFEFKSEYIPHNSCNGFRNIGLLAHRLWKNAHKNVFTRVVRACWGVCI